MDNQKNNASRKASVFDIAVTVIFCAVFLLGSIFTFVLPDKEFSENDPFCGKPDFYLFRIYPLFRLIHSCCGGVLRTYIKSDKERVRAGYRNKRRK